jgi:translation initiation factor 4A
MSNDNENNDKINIFNESNSNNNSYPKHEYEVVDYESWDDIEELQERADILRGIYGYGFEKPSPIQKRAIRPFMLGYDIIAQAQSGTGKTGCFAIGSLYRINPKVRSLQAMVMAPTRELSRQISSVISSISTQIEGFKSYLLVGGTSSELDKENLYHDVPHIVIGCPGRIHNMLHRKYIDPRSVKLIVIDEADEMLSQGFKEQVYNIFQFLPSDVQVGLFSATMPADLYSLTEKFMRDPVKILVKSEMLSLEGIAQYYVGLEDDSSKYATLKDLYGRISMSQCIIYCNSVKKVADLHEAMVLDGYPACCIHSNMDKDERVESYNNFKNGKFRVLISSNVTARGIDIQQVSTVINFDVPRDVYTYLHRIGRSGRWGRKGVGINFVTKRDFRKIKEIEAYYHTNIQELPENF